VVLQSRIRNFCIIAHIDHGKSTLADRVLQATGALSEREMRSQVLDSMDLERERGITIKAQAVRVHYTAADGETYQLNLIDTPGHVDFSYEVSRSLAACEGALLVVDASQGIEAQTLANAYLAIEGDLELIPVLNKIDLPAAEPELHGRAVADLVGEDPGRVLRISAKTGQGVDEVLEAIVARVPPPAGDPEAPARALIFDSVYDQYRGVVAFVRVVDGAFRQRDRLRAMQTGLVVEAEEIGVMSPAMTPTGSLGAGETGYLVTGLKSIGDLRVGDTGRRRLPRPARRAGEALAERRLAALGAGDLAGARVRLPLRLPGASAHGHRARAAGARVRSRAAGHDAEREPYVRCTVLVPQEGVGAVMGLCQDRRGVFVTMEPIEHRQQIVYDLPLAEIVLDFYDQLKSRTRGYASLDYEIVGYRESPLVKLDVLLAGDTVDALSMIVHRDHAYARGKGLVERLHKTIPRQLFDVPVQAAVGGKILARETVKAKRKDVLAKCYGGDISRKRKLLERQKEGKKRMKQVGSVEVPQEAFLSVLRIGDDGRDGR
jgi:GTP-binding protein LepA